MSFLLCNFVKDELAGRRKYYTKMKFPFVKDLFRKRVQIDSNLCIFSHLLKKFRKKNFIFFGRKYAKCYVCH